VSRARGVGLKSSTESNPSKPEKGAEYKDLSYKLDLLIRAYTDLLKKVKCLWR